MSIGDIETFSVFGVLDSDITADGEPLSAYLLRVIAMNSNRLVGKGHTMAALWWPSRDTLDLSAESDSDVNFEGTSAPSWRLIHPPIVCPKKPGLTTASVRMSALTVEAGDTVRFQFVTQATGGLNIHATTNDNNVVEYTGNGSFDDAVDLDLLPIDPGPFETISIYVQGQPTGRISDDGTYGTPTDHDGTTGVLSVWTNSLERGECSFNLANWNETGSGSPDLGTAGSWIVFEDLNRDPIAAPRQIINVSGPTNLHFRPALTDNEARRASDAATAGAFSIYDAPRWAICNIQIKADDR